MMWEMPDFRPAYCGHCNRDVSGEVKHATGQTQLVVCTNPECGRGIVLFERDGDWLTLPGKLPGEAFTSHLPTDVDRVWQEARSCFAVGAFTATEMLCRKLLMHLAVGAAGAAENLNFVGYVDALDEAGFIAPGLKQVVDLVRQRGNAANHELPASGATEAEMTLEITQHMLRTIYVLPGLAPAAPG